ncbi:MAG: hypothetical protein ACKVY0_03235 [Prosthecobacter sp.]|uniref:hypothetical protein n=1 Tax=Prosthecobacter sp. TaxID=1965333 RepID=UPI0038FE5669
MFTSRPAHSAQVSMVLHLGAQDVPLAQMGPDFIILKQALTQEARPMSASITLKVDERLEEIPVDFPQGIPAGQRRVALSEVNEAVAA